ncbi:MAG: Competence-like protein [Candidatus Nomurabacteria bacterium GW2011_GWD1_44_10]|nr:MAG: Competence-like protein [Candidatus Nomurabacteria bacterium GW2011_GWD1_44_10]
MKSVKTSSPVSPDGSELPFGMLASRKAIFQLVAIIVFGLTVWVWFSIISTQEMESTVYFLDVGQGDSQLVVLASQNNKSSVKILIDAGSRRKVLDALDEALGTQDNKYIDVIMMTHPDLDHFGGFVDVIKRYDVGFFISNGNESDSDSFLALKEVLAEYNVPTLTLLEGDAIRYGDSILFIMSPDKALLGNKERNEAGIVAKLTSEDATILFTADIGFLAEQVLLKKNYDLSADVLKVGHHGSKNSSGESFVATVRPLVSVIGVGQNRYGHPTPRVLETLELAGARMYRTDRDGTVKVILSRNATPRKTRAQNDGFIAAVASIMTGGYKKGALTTIALSQIKEKGEKREFNLIPHKECSFRSGERPAHSPIIINEIAWMGTVASTNDEWFEIKNNTGHTIDISQWALNAKDGTPHVKLAGTIKPHEYLIFERTDNSVVKDVEAHATTTGALNNSGEQLTLSHDAVVFDQTPDGEWVAGATSTRQTMERYSSREPGTDPENWSTNLGDTRTQQERYDCYRKLDKQFKDTRECFTKGFIKNGTDADGNAIGGTPGAQNSISTLVNKGQNITEDFTLTADEEVYVIPDGGNVYVDASSTLTIEPGVTISFYGGQWDEKQIIIEGTLDAKGTSENPIVFNSFFPNNQIGGIHFSAGASTSTMSYVRMESTNGIMLTDGAKLSIQDSQFVDNYSGVESDGKNTVTIENTNFKNTEEEPVWAYNGGFVSIASSTIIDTIDGAAIDVSDGVTLNVGSTIIDGAYDWANAGIEAYGSNVSITNSTIRNTIAEGVSAYSSNVLIASSTVSDTMENGMYLYNSSSTIINSTIEDVVGWSGVSAEGGTILIASSTIKNVLNDGIGLYDSISTISNTVIKDGTGDGIEVQGGTATITNATVSGFAGSGILTSSFVEDVFTDDGSYSGLWTIVTSTVESIVITGGEVAGNAVGVDVSSADSAIISDVYIHDNGTSEADNIVGYP